MGLLGGVTSGSVGTFDERAFLAIGQLNNARSGHVETRGANTDHSVGLYYGSDMQNASVLKLEALVPTGSENINLDDKFKNIGSGDLKAYKEQRNTLLGDKIIAHIEIPVAASTEVIIEAINTLFAALYSTSPDSIYFSDGMYSVSTSSLRNL